MQSQPIKSYFLILTALVCGRGCFPAVVFPVSISSNSPAPAKVTPSWNREKWSWGDSHNEHDHVHSINLRPVPVQRKSVVRWEPPVCLDHSFPLSHLRCLMDHSCCKIRQPWIALFSDWPLLPQSNWSLTHRGLSIENGSGLNRTAHPTRGTSWLSRCTQNQTDWQRSYCQRENYLASQVSFVACWHLLLQTWHTCQQTQL